MDKFKFIKGLYTDEVVVNKPNTELAVDINGNVITAGQKNDEVFQDQILNGVNDNSAPLKIYTVTGEMLKPVASLSPNKQSLILNRLICRESSREGNTLPDTVKTSFEALDNYTKLTLKFSGTRTWNIGGNTKTLCELQLNNGVSYNKNAVLKASGQLTKHSFVLVENGPASGKFHPGVTLNTSVFSSGAFKDGKHYDEPVTYRQESLKESSSWSDIKSGLAWKCQGSKDFLYSVSTANEISANDATLELDLTEKIKSGGSFTIGKYDRAATGENAEGGTSTNLTTPVYKFTESTTIVLNSELVYTKEDGEIISAPSGSKILVNGQLTSDVEGKKSDTVYDGDVQLISGSVYKGSTEDETIYYNMSDETVEITDDNYGFTGDEGHEINADKILYEKKDITFSVDFVD